MHTISKFIYIATYIKIHEKYFMVSKNPKVRCKGVDDDGSVCKAMTSHLSGYCPTHRKKMDKYFHSITLHCKDCAEEVRKECPYKDVAPLGLCYFELYDKVDWVTKDKLTEGMRLILKSNYKLLRRMERIISKDQDLVRGKLIDRHIKLGDNLLRQMHNYGRFKGWEEPKIPAEEKRQKIEVLKKMFKIVDEKSGGKEILDVYAIGVEESGE